MNSNEDETWELTPKGFAYASLMNYVGEDVFNKFWNGLIDFVSKTAEKDGYYGNTPFLGFPANDTAGVCIALDTQKLEK